MEIDEIKRVANDLQEDVVAFCQQLLQTPSMSGQEEAVCKLAVSKMEELAYDDVCIDGVGNAVGHVIGEHPGAPVYMLNSHLDHVDPGERSEWKHDPYSGEIEDGKIVMRDFIDTVKP